MAVALLLTTALALAGFLATSVQGFSVGAGMLHGVSAAKAVVGRHVGYAIPTVLLSLFSQSMVIFYFIGTGKLLKDEAAAFPDAERSGVLAAVRSFKRDTSPAATLALASAIAVFVLGGAAHTRALPSSVHLVSALSAVGLHSWAIVAEWRAFSENNRLMADPRAYALRGLRGG